jgi:hypothetical protein
MANRREFLKRCLALVPASIVGRGFLKSANVPKAAHAIASLPTTGIDENGLNRADGWHLYESNGQSMFQSFGESGGVCTKTIAYLVRKKAVMRGSGRLYMYDVDGGDLGRGSGTCWEYEREVIPLEFTDLEFIATDYDEEAVKRLINLKIEYAIKHRKPRPVNLDGGNLPQVSMAEREAEAAYFSARNWRGLQHVEV